MVKKKTSKRNVKVKGAVKKNSANKSLRKDFEVFARGVERLEQLKKELSSLDITGHEAESDAIRSKLNNVSYIPEVEKEMRILKSKISGNYSVTSGRVVPSENKDVSKKIKELEKKVEKRRKVSTRKQLSKQEVKLVKEVPKIENELRVLKKFIQQQQDEGKRKKDLLKKIDPGVNFLIDNSFNLTLNEIKAELSKKLKSRQLEVQNQLQDDLGARKKNFELQYRDLQNRFEQKYEKRVEDHLENEVRKRFNDALKKRVEDLHDKMQKEAIERFGVLKKELDAKEQKKLKELEYERSSVKKKLASENAKKLYAEEKRLKVLLNSKAVRELEKKINELKKKEIRGSKGLEEKKKGLIRRLNEQARQKLESEKKRLKKNERRVLVDLIQRQEKLKSIISGEKEQKIKINKKELKISLSKEKIGELQTKLRKEFLSNKNNLSREYGARLIEERRKMHDHFKEQVLAHRAKLNNQMHEHLTSEVRKLHVEHESKKKEADLRVSSMKRRVETERGALSRIRNKLNVERRKLLENEKSYRQEIRDKLEQEKQEAIKDKVREQSALIKSKLSVEFHQRLKLEVKSKQAEFEQKKADLALEIQRKAKSLFI